MGDGHENLSRAGRKKGSKNKRTAMLEAIGQTFDEGEIGFWLKVCERVDANDAGAMKIVADRLTATKKSVKVDANVEHSRREFSDTERVERLASVFQRGGEARDRLIAVLGHLVGDDRPPDGGSEE